VKNYLFRVFDKLGVSNRVELVLSCLRQEEVAREEVTEAAS
jgi:DNA-binding NarL/FixJ family response regulator